MATILRNGSRGSEVKNLQVALAEQGYDIGSTGADGIYGKKTEAAVSQYQKDNGLTVDGLAGENTLGSLYGSNKAAAPAKQTAATATPKTAQETAPKVTSAGSTSKATTSTSAAPATEAPKTVTLDNGFTYEAFDPATDPVIQQANALLQQHINSRPGDYTPVWQDDADAYLSQYQNRGPFSYDFNSDALYQQYKDQYIQQGRLAMMDTMGQAQAMTGGYGNSYAQSVGQQAYNQQLGQLNEIMPELYGMAYDRYQQEGQNLLNMYNLYMDREADEYSKYQDSMNNWYNNLTYLTENANTAYDRAYSEWAANTDLGLGGYEDAYNREQDALDEEWRQKEWDETIRQDNYDKLLSLISSGYTPTASELAEAGMTQLQADALKDYYTSQQTTNTGGNDGVDDVYYTDFDWDTQQKWQKTLSECNNHSDVANVVANMIAAGIDPKEAERWGDNRSAEINAEHEGYEWNGSEWVPILPQKTETIFVPNKAPIGSGKRYEREMFTF